MSNKGPRSFGELMWHFVWIVLSTYLIWAASVSLIEGSNYLKLDVGVVVMNHAALLLRIPMLYRCIYGD